MMSRLELGSKWTEIRELAGRIELLNDGANTILLNVRNDRREPGSDAPVFPLNAGQSRTFGAEYVSCEIWARFESGTARATILRNPYRGPSQ